ncbi:pro-sigmaK processing inhibitor BofA family protein [Priestia taiwanensis]|uniref:Sigma-K factor-processing regulatory protein BofA n=1 Tax=Priestia taiwanensis TaxID=1347902 RepID=A0A917AY10_9BACI|nr:pro-sigmaK processing inhibitor BofA family protein [Priestia taiwanensis]MBM7365272.1 inhibitor of the pro-sigma K processing machinery [Priestia taiwanensis]GGE85951.1 sigma-K factor-processing regulatory protein BofA [Priestia taiwanensis]
MNPVIVISVIIGSIVLLLLAGSSIKPVRIVSTLCVKFIIGVVVLFVINIIGAQFDFHLPINAITVAITGFLGIPGILALSIIQVYIL